MNRPFRDRRSVDDSFDIHSDNRLTSFQSTDERPNGYGPRLPTPSHSAAAESSLRPTRGAGADPEEQVEFEETSQMNAPPPSINELSPTDRSAMILHVDEGGRIPNISSIKGRNRFSYEEQHIEGLYLVSIPETRSFVVDVVFVHDIGGSHPYEDWLNQEAPTGDGYLPGDVEAYIPLARVWAYGYQTGFDDYRPLSTAANNFLVYYGEQRQRDRRNNPSVDDAAVPKLVFICVGIGGIVVKTILLECVQSGSKIRESIAKSCQGIVFNGTPHLPVQKRLALLSRAIKIFPKCILRNSMGRRFPNLDALLKEVNMVNQGFLSHFAEMPSTFCVVNLNKLPFLPNSSHAIFPPEIRRKGRDEYLSVTQRTRVWTTSLHKDHPIFIAIMTHIRGWSRTSNVLIPPIAISTRREQVTEGLNLLSVDGGGVRGLASLLVIERIMREIARIEIAAEPSTAHRPRIPADYFDLAGGTSTGGLICIMLFRLRMDVQSAIVEYRRLSPQIFHSHMTRYLGSNIAKTAFGMPWFKSEALEAGVKGIVKDRLSWNERESLGAEVEDARLVSSIESTRENSCKTFLCALKKEDDSAVRFRAYPAPNGTTAPFSNCKIWEAARATSAAPFYFPSAVVDGVKYWDGGLANNNPVLEVLAEQSQLYSQQPVNSMISLGTGFSERKPSKSTLAVLGKGKRILNNVTNVNINHERAREQLGTAGVPYFRFNPSTAEDEIGLADYKLLDALARHTATYLDREDIKAQIKQCAELLHHRPTTSQQAESELPASETRL